MKITSKKALLSLKNTAAFNSAKQEMHDVRKLIWKQTANANVFLSDGSQW